MVSRNMDIRTDSEIAVRTGEGIPLNPEKSLSSDLRAIDTESHSEDNVVGMYTSFYWSSNVLVQDIIKKIEQGQYQALPFDFYSHNDFSLYAEDLHVYCSCINNFVELGKKLDMYKGSFGTDGNFTTSWKIQTPNGNWFFVIGKYNHTTSKEDIVIFYNDSSFFEVIKCRLVAGGSLDDEPFQSLWDICRKQIYQISET